MSALWRKVGKPLLHISCEGIHSAPSDVEACSQFGHQTSYPLLLSKRQDLIQQVCYLQWQNVWRKKKTANLSDRLSSSWFSGSVVLVLETFMREDLKFLLRTAEFLRVGWVASLFRKEKLDLYLSARQCHFQLQSSGMETRKVSCLISQPKLQRHE